MEVIELEIFNFDELDEAAKEKAREWYLDGMDYPWFSESVDSIRAFCNHFNVALLDWQIGSYGNDYIKTNAQNSNFRGVKLADIDREYMPTGFCLDCDLWHEFHDQFKRTGDAKYSFEQALESALSAIRRDIDYQYTDESVDENIRINEYQFLKSGKPWTN